MSAPTDRPSIVVIPSPFRGDRGRVKVLEPPDCNRRRIREELLSGDYRKPFVLEERGARSLHFSRALVQSGMRLDDPCALEFAYTREMMAFLLLEDEGLAVIAGEELLADAAPVAIGRLEELHAPAIPPEGARNDDDRG